MLHLGRICSSLDAVRAVIIPGEARRPWRLILSKSLKFGLRAPTVGRWERLFGVAKAPPARLSAYPMGFTPKKTDCPIRGTSSFAISATRSTRQERQTDPVKLGRLEPCCAADAPNTTLTRS